MENSKVVDLALSPILRRPARVPSRLPKKKNSGSKTSRDVRNERLKPQRGSFVLPPNFRPKLFDFLAPIKSRASSAAISLCSLRDENQDQAFKFVTETGVLVAGVLDGHGNHGAWFAQKGALYLQETLTKLLSRKNLAIDRNHITVAKLVLQRNLSTDVKSKIARRRRSINDSNVAWTRDDDMKFDVEVADLVTIAFNEAQHRLKKEMGWKRGLVWNIEWSGATATLGLVFPIPKRWSYEVDPNAENSAYTRFKYVSANVGDSDGMTYINNDDTTIDITTKVHHLGDKEEELRVLQSGGRIIDLRVFMQEKDTPGLAVSRTLGDVAAHELLGVSAEPSVACKTLTFNDFEEGESHCVLLASDGLWDYVDRKEAVHILEPFVKRILEVDGSPDADDSFDADIDSETTGASAKEKICAEAVKHLVDISIARQTVESSDNTSAVLVVLS